MNKIPYRFKDWILEDKLDWVALSFNPNAIYILEKNLDKVNWKWLSGNKNAIHILEKNIDKIDWASLSLNPNAIHLLKKYPENINWFMISMNSNAYDIIISNLDKINKSNLCLNTNKNILRLLLNSFPSFMEEGPLSANESWIELLNELKLQIPHDIYWHTLSLNPSAIHILKENKDKIDWYFISYNTEIFEIDYLKL